MSKTLTTDLSLFDFAYCGDRRAFTENSLINLSSLAETENWDGPGQKGNYDVLFYYIVKTWEIVASQGKISCTDEEDLALFNTGLLTENGEEIYGCFQPNTRAESNPKAQKWFFKGFYKESTRFLSDYIFEKPEIARYDNNLAEFHFDMDTPSNSTRITSLMTIGTTMSTAFPRKSSN